jgi:Regulator of Vps4 activity in the MVB pathway
MVILFVTSRIDFLPPNYSLKRIITGTILTFNLWEFIIYHEQLCRECPVDLKEGISSIIYAAPRCSELPELLHIRDMFEKKYGKDFVTAAIELRTDSCVNRHVCFHMSIHFRLFSSLAPFQ